MHVRAIVHDDLFFLCGGHLLRDGRVCVHPLRNWYVSDRHRADLLHGLPPGKLLCFGDCDIRRLLPRALLINIRLRMLGLCIWSVLCSFVNGLHRLFCWHVFNNSRDCLPELPYGNLLCLPDGILLKLWNWIHATEHWCISVHWLFSGFLPHSCSQNSC